LNQKSSEWIILQLYNINRIKSKGYLGLYRRKPAGDKRVETLLPRSGRYAALIRVFSVTPGDMKAFFIKHLFFKINRWAVTSLIDIPEKKN